MERQRALVIVFLILYFLLSPDTSQPSQNQRNQLKDQVQREHWDLKRLQNASYGHFPHLYHGEHNATGLQDQDGIFWSLLPEIQKRARAQFLELLLDTGKVNKDDIATGSERAYEVAAESSLAFYQNVSGTIRGGFVRRLPNMFPRNSGETSLKPKVASPYGYSRTIMQRRTCQCGR